MKYVAFFRGLNVGGKGLAKMADLRAMLEALGLEGVKTYIQSGNAVFGSDDEPDLLKTKIEAGFAGKFGFESKAIIRSKDEIAAIAANPSFPANLIESAIAANPNVEHVYIYFLDTIPSAESIHTLQIGYEGPDKLLRGERELFLLCHDSIRDSKLAAALVKLGIPMTSRNWKTLNHIHAMMDA